MSHWFSIAPLPRPPPADFRWEEKSCGLPIFSHLFFRCPDIGVLLNEVKYMHVNTVFPMPNVFLLNLLECH